MLETNRKIFTVSLLASRIPVGASAEVCLIALCKRSSMHQRSSSKQRKQRIENKAYKGYTDVQNTKVSSNLRQESARQRCTVPPWNSVSCVDGLALKIRISRISAAKKFKQS